MSFHSYYDARVRRFQTHHATKGWKSHDASKQTKGEDTHLTYSFHLHEHPYVTELVNKLVKTSVKGLQDADTEYQTKPDGSPEPLKNAAGKVQTRSDGTLIPRPHLYKELFSNASYNPSGLVGHPYPVMDLDFTLSGAYSVYNWELFYHLPMGVAIQLSKNQCYEQAQRWFHYVFDPTDNSHGPTPERFWKVKPFQHTDAKLVEEVLVNLSTATNSGLRQETINSIEAWKHDPFRPFLVARYRQSAFMFKAVTAYLDNLIDWGDSLFSQYTGETINEAAQIYILAANILGPRPQAVPKKGSEGPQTYASLRSRLDQFGNALVDLETDVAFDLAPHPNKAAGTGKLNTLNSVGKSLYFCVPRNDKLLRYWDTVADRLFKIRHSLNIQGIFQRVPLFEPPIDPALLARGAAEGLDVSAIVSGLNQPIPLVRFQYLLQRATEMCQEVKSLGNNLLSAMEKKDSEALSILRAKHETCILQLAESVKYSAWQEAIKNREGLEQSLNNATARYSYYERLLGKKESEIQVPQLDPIDPSALGNMKFHAREHILSPRDVDIDIASDLGASGGIPISSHESSELNKLDTAHTIRQGVEIASALAKALIPIPDTKVDLHFWGIGTDVSLPGGEKLAQVASYVKDIALYEADQLTYDSNRAGKIAGYSNREREYQFQSGVVAGEINQLFKQIHAAQIREAMAEREWDNHKKQIEQSQKIEQFLTDNAKGKVTNQAFYTWMKREVKGLYGHSFQFAFEIARKAERALQQELGDPGLSYIQYGYLAGKEGLLAGERLYHDLKRMEMAYAELNRREYELTKHVSFQQVSPVALLQLRTTGSCTVTVPEESFDLDCPGHYFRRIRSVAVSIPCVMGPYASLNCRLTLLKSSIRTTTLPGENGYSRDGADDSRFSDFFGSLQSIVTSTGQNDSGMFETNLHDERKLPFEWSGAVSQWQLDLPAGVRQLDFDTISDVILHLRYTAREGGNTLRSVAVANLENCIADGRATGSVRLVSARHEFPTEWAKFTGVKLGASTKSAALAITVRPEHYPFWSRGRLGAVLGLGLYAPSTKDIRVSDKADGTGNNDELVKDDSFGGFRAGILKNIALPSPTGQWTFWFDDNSMKDIWLAIRWGKQQ